MVHSNKSDSSYLTTSTDTTEWIKDAVIYQAFVGRWDIASARKHTGAVLRELAQLDWKTFFTRGFNTIYLLGLFDSRGPIVVTTEDGIALDAGPDRVPSVFALRDHQSLHPDLGSLKDLKTLIGAIHMAGGRVIVDFVPNHTGLDHPWISDHPDYYLPDREFSGDVAKLNYLVPAVRAAMTDVLKHVSAWGIDGFRCDMAHLVPDSFWVEALAVVRLDYPHIAFIAEAYPETVFDWSVVERLLADGFDVIYHEALYRNIKSVFSEGAPSNYLDDHIAFVQHSPLAPHLLSYLSNHDDPIPAGAERDAPALWQRMKDLPGPLLIYNGSLLGFHRRLHHHTFDTLTAEQTELIQTLPNWWTTK